MKKGGKGFMKKLVCLIFGLLLFALSACQPTPEVEPVPNKGDFTLEKKIEEARSTSAPTAATQTETTEPQPTEAGTTEPQPTEAGTPQPIVIPERWVDRIESGGWVIPIDAEIVAEQKDSYPVYIIKKKTFTNEEFDRIANAFFEDRVTGQCFEPIWMWEFTQEEFEYAVQRALDAGLDWYAEILFKYEKDSIRERVFEDTTRIQADLDENGCYHTFVRYTAKDGTERVGYALVEADRFQCYNRIRSEELPPDFVREEWNNQNDPMLDGLRPEITLEEAKAAAEDFLKRAGLEEFHYSGAEVATQVITEFTEIYGTGWWLEYNNPFGYVAYESSKASGNGPFQFNSIQVSRPWDYHNFIKLYVNAEGVSDLWWSGPLEASETVDGIGIMPVEEAEGCIKRLLTYGLPRHYGDITMKVTKMILGSAMQPMKDNQELAYMVPAWVIEVQVYNVNPRTGVADTEPLDTLYYSFSAVDGTYLDWHPTI